MRIRDIKFISDWEYNIYVKVIAKRMAEQKRTAEEVLSEFPLEPEVKQEILRRLKRYITLMRIKSIFGLK